MKKLILALLATLLLVSGTGCGQKAKKLSCTKSDEAGGKDNVNINYEGDKITAISVITEMEIEPDMTDFVVGLLSYSYSVYDAVKGITTSTVANEDKTVVTITINIDYKKLDKEALAKLVESIGSTDSLASDFTNTTSMKKYRTKLETEGYTCK